MTRKALISTNYGAGWSTWADEKYREDALFDPQLIAAVEVVEEQVKGLPSRDAYEVRSQVLDAAIAEWLERLEAKHGEGTYFYTGGGRDLRVVEIDGPFIVEEYDGNEYIIARDETNWL